MKSAGGAPGTTKLLTAVVFALRNSRPLPSTRFGRERHGARFCASSAVPAVVYFLIGPGGAFEKFVEGIVTTVNCCA
jgi:hypothetical protein